ncbi:hypothetical protein TrLO_g15620 [Triparma laevis f. longispina]|uniref:Tyrosine-protein kinase ephrin type A/B receptor-like domain-containing protein n=1 Tax=Triparma laevis f. longispina TaxID=1714387 RepID=A0A9W7FPN4_9STRA|nr:hypothetical protein TrLO_g15620 [Triparma laevis f. longispina]
MVSATSKPSRMEERSSCRSGTYYNESQNTGIDCASGNYTATGGNGAGQCKDCDDGFFSASPGAATCFACEAGKCVNAEQTQCLLYSAGKISGVASNDCTVCEAGKFAEGEGNVECKFCNDDEVLRGSTTNSTGTASKSRCVCPKREYQDHQTASCEKVREGVREDIQGMNVTTLNLINGYWRTASNPYEVLPCLGMHHCTGGTDPAKMCAEGYEGPLCAVYSKGYAALGSGADLVCNVCTGSAEGTVTVGLALIGGKKEDEQSLTLNDGQAPLDTGSRLERQTSRARAISESAQAKVAAITEFIDNVHPFAKIFLASFEVVGGLSFTLRLRFPPMFTKFMNICKNVLSLEVILLRPSTTGKSKRKTRTSSTKAP